MISLPPFDATRSDVVELRTLADRVRLFLECRGIHSEQIRVDEVDGSIVLEGAVGRYYDRQVALSCAQHVPGVRHVIDHISVGEPRNASARLQT